MAVSTSAPGEVRRLGPDRAQELIHALGKDRLVQLLRTMQLIRKFEDTAEQLYSQGKVYGTMHLSAGEEASATGAIAALRPDDYILSTHRGHGHCLAKGASVALMMAEFLGKSNGYCRGRGGSMHIADVDTGNLGANGVVGGGLPIAPGVGLSIKLRRSGQVAMVFFGDGASNEGAFHESLNMASIWDLPLVYVCENNQYGMSMPVRRAMKVASVAERAASYAIPGVQVDGQDLLTVYDAARVAVERARSGGGPSLIEAFTYRYKGHSKSDQQAYRTRDEVSEWRTQRDPILMLQARLIAAGMLSEGEAAALDGQAAVEIAEAVEVAFASPDADPATLLEGVYA